MENIKIKVYSKLNEVEDNSEFNAIKKENVIKYIDLEKNKMMIDMENDLIIRDNIDYCFTLDFKNNFIDIGIKKIHKNVEKSIKTLTISKSSNKYLVRYLLTDENIINEYYVKF